VTNFADKFMETSFEEIDSRQPKVTPRTTGDSPILQIRKKNVPLTLPDWQPSSAVEPAEDSPIVEVAPLELLWPPIATEYADQQAVDESPVHAEQKSDISSQPINWEQLDKPVPAAVPAKFPSVTKQIIEGDIYETEEKTETDKVAKDGSDCSVRRLMTTRRQLLPVSELTLEDGVEVSRTTSEVVVGVHIDEFVYILSPGVDDPHADGLQTETSVKESEEPLETGGTVTRRVTTKTVCRIEAPEISQKPDEGQPHHPADVEVMQDGKNRVNEQMECLCEICFN